MLCLEVTQACKTFHTAVHNVEVLSQQEVATSDAFQYQPEAKLLK